jgi:signal transduction histidine kinase
VLSYCFGHRITRTWVLPSLILAVGVAASTAFLVIGIEAANQDALNSFQRTFEASVRDLQETWYDYISAGLWLHEVSRTATAPGGLEGGRQAFREIYEHVTYRGGDNAIGGRVVDLKAVAFAPNVSNEDRPAYEAEAMSYYRNYPSVKYNGFQGLEPQGNAVALQARSNQSYYYPIQYIEPVEGNEAFVGFDLLSCQYTATSHALATWTPTVTNRMKIETNETDPNSYSVILLHPGTPLTTEPDLHPKVLTMVVVGIASLLNRSASRWSIGQADVYLYDATNVSTPSFLGAACVHSHDLIHLFNETDYSSLKGRRLFQEQIINVGDRQWIMAAVPVEGSHVPNLAYVILGACLILAACVGIAVWVRTSALRSERYGALQSAAEAEKAASEAERSLGDFVAHEVRNPVAAAISACTFVRAAVNEDEPLVDPTTREATREDVDIVYNSLQYVNDLLRNMLEIHRATDKQLHATMESTDLLRDVLEPVDSMLYRRNGRFAVHVDCPKDLYVTTDRLRLKQIVLNLALNSSKFIDGEGCYIKMGAKVVDGMVQLTVEDTGPGVPHDKRHRLFSKFQSSLDNLNQGTVRFLRSRQAIARFVELIARIFSLSLDRASGCTCARCWRASLAPTSGSTRATTAAFPAGRAPSLSFPCSNPPPTCPTTTRTASRIPEGPRGRRIRSCHRTTEKRQQQQQQQQKQQRRSRRLCRSCLWTTTWC